MDAVRVRVSTPQKRLFRANLTSDLLCSTECFAIKERLCVDLFCRVHIQLSFSFYCVRAWKSISKTANRLAPLNSQLQFLQVGRGRSNVV
jgi:hypothetical protein